MADSARVSDLYPRVRRTVYHEVAETRIHRDHQIALVVYPKGVFPPRVDARMGGHLRESLRHLTSVGGCSRSVPEVQPYSRAPHLRHPQKLVVTCGLRLLDGDVESLLRHPQHLCRLKRGALVHGSPAERLPQQGQSIAGVRRRRREKAGFPRYLGVRKFLDPRVRVIRLEAPGRQRLENAEAEGVAPGGTEVPVVRSDASQVPARRRNELRGDDQFIGQERGGRHVVRIRAFEVRDRPGDEDRGHGGIVEGLRGHPGRKFDIQQRVAPGNGPAEDHDGI